MKKKSLLVKNIVRLFILGLVILLGTGLASGIHFYRESMGFFRELAVTFVDGAVENIHGNDVEQVIEEGDNFDPFDWTNALDSDDYFEKYGHTSGLYMYWWEVQRHFTFTKDLNDNILSCYIAIPDDEDLIYIWDAELSEKDEYTPFARRGYYPEEEENLKRAMNNDQENVFAYFRDGELIWTVVRGIRNSKNEPVAVVAIDITLKGILSSFRNLMLNLAITLSLIMAAACVVYYLVLKRSFLGPLLSMEQKTSGLVERLKSGSEEPLQMDVHTGDEIESLADVLEDMGQSLVTYIRESEEAAVEREHIASEMRLAGSIQAHMLPDLTAFLEEQKEIELCASMNPAKAVGGDFYDCFSIDQEHTAFVIADVSGNGVPAALFMALTRTLIRSIAADNLSPASILTKVNKQICSTNQDKMFVTVWMGILNPITGTLKACNAGHEYPILKNPGGTYELMKDLHSFIIGVKEDLPYQEYELQLQKGSILFVYTDGVTEAMNSDKELFGTDRILGALNSADPEAPEGVLDAVKTAVCDFAKDKASDDDITMMCLRYLGDRLDCTS